MSIVTKLATALATAALAAVAVPAYGAITAYDGPMRWETPSVTITDTTGEVDVEAISEAWGDTVEIIPVDGPADVTFVSVENFPGMTGGEAHREFVDGTHYIESCRIDVKHADPEILTHELGHCLGLSHTNMQQSGSNMHWIAKDYQNGWSDHVTSRDLKDLAALYR